MSDSAALDSFLDKWRARWPEWSVGEIFVVPERRDIAVAWFALLQEFDDALNVAGDPLPADAKLAWWGEELRGWAARRSRHPLGRRLEPVRADWARLADALPVLSEGRAQPADRDAGFSALSRYGEAVMAVEAGVLGDAPGSHAIVVQTLAMRLAETGAAGIPVDHLQAGNDAAAARAWAASLLAEWPLREGACERRLVSAYAHGRLRRLAERGEPAPLPSRASLLFTGWRAARGG